MLCSVSAYLTAPLRRLAVIVVGLLAAPAAPAQTPTWHWALAPATTSTTVCRSTAVDALGQVYVTGSFRGTVTFGTTTLVSAGDEDIFVAKLSSAGTCEWAVRAGGQRAAMATSIAVDGLGNVLVGGKFDSTATFGATRLRAAGISTADVFVAKLSPTGTWQWAARAGTRGNDYGAAVATDSSGNAVLVGYFSGSATSFAGADTLSSLPHLGSAPGYIAKLSPTGVWQWATPLIGRAATSKAVAVDRWGNILLTGDFTGSLICGDTSLYTSAGGCSEVFVAKLAPTGTWQWATKAACSSNAAGYTITTDAGGNALVAGIFSASAIFGTTTLTSSFWTNAFVAKLSPAGIWQWATQVAGNTVAAGIAVDSRNHVLVTGTYSSSNPATFGPIALTNAGSYDIFAAQLSPLGAWEWATNVSSIGSDYAGGIAAGGAGQVVLAGTVAYTTTSFDPLAFPEDAHPFIAGFTPSPLAVAAATSAAAAFTLAPNPARETVRLTGATGAATATLLDGLGRVVRRVPLAAGAATLDVRGLPAGLYVVRAGLQTRRLVVE